MQTPETNNEPRPPSLVDVLKRTPVNTAIIAICVAVAIISNLGNDLHVLTWLTLVDLRGENTGLASGFAAIMRGEVWRVVTPIFIHFGLLHICFNLLWTKDLGSLIELRWTSRTYLTLVIVSAVLSNVCQYLLDWDYLNGFRTGNGLSGGMSGVVYAMLGYVWLRGKYDPTAGISLNGTVIVIMIGWLLFCMSGYLGGIANTAHLVGLLVGIAMGGLAAARMRRQLATRGQDLA